MNPKFCALHFFLVVSLLSLPGPATSTEDIDGKSDLDLVEAKRSVADRMEEGGSRPAATMGPGLLEQKDYWFLRLVFNLLSYSTVLVPCFLLVTLVKRRKYLERPATGFYRKAIQLLVEGYDFLSLDEMNSHKSTSANHDASFFGQTISLCLHGLGLLTSYLIWGLLQERVMVFEYRTEDPNSPGERFSNSQFVVFSNRVLAFVVAVAANLLLRQPQHRAPAYKYLYSSFSNVMSSWCQYEALKFVSFPVQVLAKTSKVIPVMLMGRVVSRRTYTCFEYATAAAISLGVFLFLVTSDDYATGGQGSKTTLAGVVILVGYLAFDSFTSNWQDEMFTRYRVSSLQMMAGVNAFSVLLTFVSLLEQGTLVHATSFMYRHPLFALHVLVLSLTSAVGQLFIFSTIARFGPATFTIIMTIRQGLAILLSCIIFGHQVTVAGAGGVAVVFVALFVRIYHKQTSIKRNRPRKRDTTSDDYKGVDVVVVTASSADAKPLCVSMPI